jgi:hypothetical protein
MRYAGVGSNDAALQREKRGHDTPKRELWSDGLVGLMFTQVNVHGISRLEQLVKMFVVASDNYFLRQIAFGVDQVNALKRKNFL